MPSNPKGYRPEKSRVLFPLTVDEQKRALQVDEDTNLKVRALLMLSLSTGMHPKVLSKPEYYGLTWTDRYYSWNRPKTKRQVQGPWSRAMREGQNLNLLRRWLNKDVSTYRKAVGGFCEARKVSGMNMLRGRHTNFCNRARLGDHPFSIASATGTSLQVVGQYYTIGSHETNALTPEEHAFLEWLVLV